MDELGLSRTQWRKSSYSSANGQCVEVAHLDQTLAVRDSKDSEGPKLAFSARAWAAFVQGIKHDEFDL